METAEESQNTSVFLVLLYVSEIAVLVLRPLHNPRQKKTVSENQFKGKFL